MAQDSASQRSASEASKAREQLKRSTNRRRAIIVGVVALVVMGLGVATWAIVARTSQPSTVAAEASDQPSTVAAEASDEPSAGATEAADAPIPGVKETPGLAQDHIEGLPEPSPAAPGGTVLPPSGGPHSEVWQSCGVYSSPVPTTQVVHSMEHGAVWITYRPDLPQSQVDTLVSQVRGHDYRLLSPMNDLDAPVVLTAWGLQLELNDVADPRLEQFLAKYTAGPQTPEPGAPCNGGAGTPS